jgi:hypothetical protein
MYAFMNRLFALGHEEPILERDFQRLETDELRVWDAEHPAPPNGVEWEAQMLKRWAEDVTRQVDASPGLRTEGWTALIEPANRIAKTLRVEPEERRETENGPLIVRRVRNPQGTIVGEMLKRIGKASRENSPEMVHVGSAKEQPNAPLNEWALQLDDAWGIDLKASEQSLVKNPRPAACYTYGYNPPLFLRRLAVLLAMIDSGATEGLERGVWRGEGGYAAIVAAAAIVRPVGALAPADDGFEFDEIDSIRNEHFLPGALRYGGLAGLVKTARGWEPQ